MSTEADSGVKKRKDSTPPDGYVCRLCSVPGHWIQVRFISENCELMFFVVLISLLCWKYTGMPN